MQSGFPCSAIQSAHDLKRHQNMFNRINNSYTVKKYERLVTHQDFCDPRSGKFVGDRRESVTGRVREKNLAGLSQGGTPQSKRKRKSMLNEKMMADCLSMLSKPSPASLQFVPDLRGSLNGNVRGEEAPLGSIPGRNAPE